MVGLNIGDRVRFINAPAQTIKRVLGVEADHVAVIININGSFPIYSIKFDSGKTLNVLEESLQLIRKKCPGTQWWV